MNGIQSSPAVSDGFEWKPDYDELLEKNATSDFTEYDWGKLRDILKHKLDKIIAEYLAEPPSQPSSSSELPSSLEATPSGGLKLPPFPSRPQVEYVSARVGFNSLGQPKAQLVDEEARGIKESIFALMHEFDGNPPFTVQRVCELTLYPRQHYKSVGKYLRAVERSLLVTSSLDAFPIIPPEDPDAPSSSSTFISNSPTGSLREATTPLFSPIPFLHEDARRSRSRSPPMSPLELAAKRVSTPGGTPLAPVASIEPITLDAVAVGGSVIVDGPVIGLVDELDDPSPGHMSDHPTALSATTTAASVEGKPLFGSLEERFVKSEESNVAEGAPSGADDSMMVDETDADKENINKI